MSPQYQQVKKASTGERVFTILVLLCLTGAFVNLAVTPGSNLSQTQGVPEMQIAWTLVYLVTLILVARHTTGLRTLLREPLLLLLLVLALASTLWSEEPALTLRRGISLAGTVLFGLYFSRRYDLRDQLRVLAAVCWIAVIGSFIFGVFGLGTSVDRVQGAWFGIFVQRNGLGRMMVLCVIVFLLTAKIDTKRAKRSWVGLLLSVSLIFLSQSQTALLSSIILLALYPVCTVGLRGSRLRAGLTLVSLGTACVISIWWVKSHLVMVASWLNRDVTLSGRLKVWILAVVMGLRKPWWGYGYSAFWLGSQGPAARVSRALDWATPNGHNGLLDLWLDLGFLGIVIFIAGFLTYVTKALLRLRETAVPETVWPLLFLAFLVLMNLTESTLMSGNSIFWALYVAVAFSVSSSTVELAPARHRESPAPK